MKYISSNLVNLYSLTWEWSFEERSTFGRHEIEIFRSMPALKYLNVFNNHPSLEQLQMLVADRSELPKGLERIDINEIDVDSTSVEILKNLPSLCHFLPRSIALSDISFHTYIASKYYNRHRIALQE
jgi:hypothetical protein